MNKSKLCDIYVSWVIECDFGGFFLDTSALATQLSEILENQKIESVKPKEKSADEIARKEAILAQYGAVSEGETYPLYEDK